MNCRRARKLMPGLVANELEQTTAAAVRLHIESCPDCAAELAGYEQALADLAAPRAEFEVPGELLTLTMPEKKRPTLPRTHFALGLAAVAAIIILTLASLPREHHPAARTAMAPAPEQVAVIPSAPKPAVRNLEPAPKVEIVIPKRHHTVRPKPIARTIRIAVPPKPRKEPDGPAPQPEVQPKPEIVIALYLPELQPGTVEAMTVDSTTGQETSATLEDISPLPQATEQGE